MARKFSLKSLLLIVGIASIFCAAGYYAWVAPNLSAEKYIRTQLPLTEVESKEGSPRVTSSRYTYCLGRYGITDIGKLRIAIRGCTFTGSSSGSVVFLSGPNDPLSLGGSTGTGNRRFDHQGIPGGTAIEFGGHAFKIVEGVFQFDGQEHSAIDKPILIIIDEKGSIESVSDIEPQSAN